MQLTTFYNISSTNFRSWNSLTFFLAEKFQCVEANISPCKPALTNLLKVHKFEKKLCLSTKSPHKKIRWNYGISRSVRSPVQHLFLFHFRDRRCLILLNGVLFTKEIPNEIILLCMNYDVAFRTENNETWKKEVISL